MAGRKGLGDGVERDLGRVLASRLKPGRRLVARQMRQVEDLLW